MAETSTAPKPRSKSSKAENTDIGTADVVTAANTAGTAFSKVKEQASTLASEATEAARTAATQGKDKAAMALDGVAKFAEDTAQSVEDRLGPQYANYARKAAASVSSFAQDLQSKDIDELVADTKAFVRKSPALAIGTAAAVGFLLTRLVKIGSADKDDDQR